MDDNFPPSADELKRPIEIPVPYKVRRRRSGAEALNDLGHNMKFRVSHAEHREILEAATQLRMTIGGFTRFVAYHAARELNARRRAKTSS